MNSTSCHGSKAIRAGWHWWSIPSARFLVALTLASCGKPREKSGPEVVEPPAVELRAAAYRFEGSLVLWVNNEPVQVLTGPAAWTRVSDVPLKLGTNVVKVVGVAAQAMSDDDLFCSLAIRGESTPVQLENSEEHAKEGKFEIQPEQLDICVSPGVLQNGSEAKLSAWILSVVKALRDKDSDVVKAKVEGFGDLSDADASPFLIQSFQPHFAVTSTDQLEVYKGNSTVLVTARPDPQTGSPHALIEAKSGNAEWTMKQILLLHGKDGRFYLSTPLGWKKILDLEP